MEIRKSKRVVLKGKYLKALYNRVYKRDAGLCVCCGKPIAPGLKFHHEPCGSYRSDEPEKVVLLCPECHYNRHNTGKSAEVREKCVEYLHILYGEKARGGIKRENDSDLQPKRRRR